MHEHIFSWYDILPRHGSRLLVFFDMGDEHGSSHCATQMHPWQCYFISFASLYTERIYWWVSFLPITDSMGVCERQSHSGWNFLWQNCHVVVTLGPGLDLVPCFCDCSILIYPWLSESVWYRHVEFTSAVQQSKSPLPNGKNYNKRAWTRRSLNFNLPVMVGWRVHSGTASLSNLLMPLSSGCDVQKIYFTENNLRVSATSACRMVLQRSVVNLRSIFAVTWQKNYLYK